MRPWHHHLTQTKVRSLFDYEPETGVLVNKKTGNPAQLHKGTGYLRVTIEREKFYAHRIVWLWMTGVLPPAHVDHINGVKTDNRWCNLRAVSASENLLNNYKRREGKLCYRWAIQTGGRYAS